MKLKSIPTLQPTAHVEAMVNALDSAPFKTSVNRSETSITVHASRKGVEVKLFSAITADNRNWHVMACDGMLQQV